MKILFQRSITWLYFIVLPDVVSLEEKWGEFLVSQKQQDAAISHYIEAGNTVKALEAAIAAKQWKKSMQIMQVKLIIVYFTLMLYFKYIKHICI